MLIKYIAEKSIKTKLLILFLPLIILSVMLTGFCSYILSVNQLNKNAIYLLNDSIYQTGNYINDNFTNIFQQLVSTENDNSFSNLFIGSTSNATQSMDYDNIIKLNNKLENIYRDYAEILDSIYVNLGHGTELQIQKDYVAKHVGINLSDWITKYKYSDKNFYWINDHKETIFETVENRQVISTFKIVGNEKSLAQGIFLINLKSSYFLDILSNIRISPNGYAVLFSNDGVLYSKNVNSKYNVDINELKKLREKLGSSGSFNIKSTSNKKMFVVYNTVKINNWTIAAVVPENDVLVNTQGIKYISIVIIIILIFIASFVATLFAESITNSIKYLSKQVKCFEKGNFDVKFEIKDKNEIGVLANGLASLLNTVKSLLQKINVEHEKKRQIELMALQAQINPHFLYNTLGSIKHLIDMEENQRASKMVSSLTKLFMIGISKGKEIITIQEELNHIESYLTIQKMRYSKEFEYTINVDEDILFCNIIKLTLQPIIENSIYHGIKSKEGIGIIEISGKRQEDYVIVEIYDDGPGINKEKLSKLMESINLAEVEENPITFGLRNVQQRIVLHFGIKYGIDIESIENQYTKITVKIPFKDSLRGDKFV